MMIRILKTSYGHPFDRANRSTNRKMIKGGETDVTDVPKKVHNSSNVRRPVEVFSATGRQSPERRTLAFGDRSRNLATGRRRPEAFGDRSRHLATGRPNTEPLRPLFPLIWTLIQPLLRMPPMLQSTLWLKAHFVKACSLSKLGSRSSYAKDTKEIISFSQRIQGRYLWTHPTIMRTFEIIYDFGGYIDILVTCRFIVHIQCCLCHTPSTTYILKGSPPTSSY